MKNTKEEKYQKKEKKKEMKFNKIEEDPRKKRKSTFYAFLFLGIFLVVIFCFLYTLSKQSTALASAKGEDTKTYRKNEDEKVDMEAILHTKIEKTRKEEIEVEEAELEYLTQYQNSPNLAKGTVQVVQEGRTGLQEVITKRIWEGEEIVAEKTIGTKVTKAAITKIVVIGTGNYTSNHKIKKGDELYVTSDRLAIQLEPTEDSSKIMTINRNTKVKVLEVGEGWYKITYQNYTGWAKADCLTYIDPNAGRDQTESNLTKAQLLAKLNKNMALNKPSGLTLKQFKKVLSQDPHDKNKVFEQNAEYFYYIEKQYQINGIFVAAVGIHESSWGTSKIAKEKKNLFGYGAYDASAYTSAYQFRNYSEGIDLIARVYTKYYLHPKGTKIYDNQEASGKYYSGNSIEAVNKKYATDKNWNNSVYSWMEYLYQKL